MKQIHKSVLKKNHILLLKQLSNEELIISHMFQESILDDAMHEEATRPMSTRTEKVKYILRALPKKKTGAYEEFLKILKEADQDHLVAALRDTEKQLEEEKKETSRRVNRSRSASGSGTTSTDSAVSDRGTKRSPLETGDAGEAASVGALTETKKMRTEQSENTFTEVWHNNNPFKVMFLDETDPVKEKGSKTCVTCRIDFPRYSTPTDIFLKHRERWQFPGKDGEMVSLNKETSKFICAKKSCVMRRYPYFTKQFLKITVANNKRLNESQKQKLMEEFGYP